MLIVKKIIYSIVLFFLVFTGKAQTKNTKINPALLQENIQLFCDREIYLSGDYIQFYIKYDDISDLTVKQLSNIVYLELITYEGKSFIKKKLLIKNGGTSSTLKIPKELISGYYYLKVYTRWMRNYSPQTFLYIPVKILNYNSNEFITPPNKNYVSDFKIDTTTINYNRLLSIDKNIVNKKDNITVTISNIPEKTETIVVSVKSYSIYNSNILKIVPKKSKNIFDFKYLPETRGVSLSGIIIDKRNKQPTANITVNLSVIDTINYSLIAVTDSTGKFYFDFGKTYEEKELLLTVNENKKPLEILVDNDFCNQSVKLPFIPFTINSNERDFYTKFINKGIVENSYTSIDSFNIKTTENYLNLNHISPDFKIVLSDYIFLPHLADYFHELIPNVSIRRENNQSVFQVLGNFAELQIYKPLVLIDNVIVANIDKLLQISPDNIYSIETFEKPYAIGERLFGGIIHIKAKNYDLAKMELPESGIFLNYKMLDKNLYVNYKKTPSSNIPFMGNTIFWDVISHKKRSSKQEPAINSGVLSGKYIVEIKILGKGIYITDTVSYIVK
jgi:hypothetical protein